MIDDTLLPSALLCSDTGDHQSSRPDETFCSTPDDALFDILIALLEQTLPEVEIEPLPMGMRCPIRSVCPDRERKIPRVLNSNKT